MSELIKSPISTELNIGSYVAITMGSQTGYGFGIMLSDTTGFYIATDSVGTDETLIPGNVSGLSWPDLVHPGDIVMYAKAISGIPTLTLFPARKVRY